MLQLKEICFDYGVKLLAYLVNKEWTKFFNIVNFLFQDEQNKNITQMKSLEKGAKVEVYFSLVCAIGAASKGFDGESEFKPN